MAKKKRKNFNPTTFQEELKIAKEKQEMLLNRVQEEISIKEEQSLETLEKIYIDGKPLNAEKIRRGSVYHVHRDVDDSELLKGTNILNKNNRPFIVISNNVNNRNSGVITMAPLVSHARKGPYSVEFTDNKNITRMVAVNQLTAIAIEQIGSYWYTVSPEIMDKIDKALIIHENLKPYISRLVSQYVEEITGVMLPRNLDIPLDLKEDKDLTIEEVKQLINDRRPNQNDIEVSVEEDISATKEEPIKEVPPVIEKEKVEEKIKKPLRLKKHPKGSKWTEKEAKKYIEFYNTHTLEECMKAMGRNKAGVDCLIYRLKRDFT